MDKDTILETCFNYTLLRNTAETIVSDLTKAEIIKGKSPGYLQINEDEPISETGVKVYWEEYSCGSSDTVHYTIPFEYFDESYNLKDKLGELKKQADEERILLRKLWEANEKKRKAKEIKDREKNNMMNILSGRINLRIRKGKRQKILINLQLIYQVIIESNINLKLTY